MRQSSFKLWQGPSPYNGETIHAILTNAARLSKNPKTGPMPQLWIVSDTNPKDAVKMPDGDLSVCGDCKLKPHVAKNWRESCYVARFAWRAPSNTWKANIKLPTDPLSAILAIKELAYPIRLGAYGDPALLPRYLIEDIIISLHKKHKTHTAYTHMQQHAFAYWARRYAMASVENIWDAKLFWSLGWRTFRITNGPDASDNEVVCPHITRGVQCINCCLCDGKRHKNDIRKSVTIPRH